MIPWIDYRIGRRVYDANYAYYIHRFGRDETWQKNLRDLYVGRRQGTIERPPHTLVEQFKAVDKFRGNRMAEANVTAGLKITHSQNVSVLAPISRIHNVQVTNMASLAKVDNHAIATEHHVVKIAEVSKEQRAGEIKSHVDQVKKVQEQRHVEETKILGNSTRENVTIQKSIKLDLPKVVHTLPPVSRVPNRTPLPPSPVLPKHEERPIKR